MRVALSVSLLTLSVVVAAAPARGQTIDYGGFEGMFEEPVTSSATGKPERISHTPVTMDVLTAEDIKRSGVRDLASLIRTLPGVISYRGYNGTESFSMGALLLNGREIYVASFDETLLAGLPVELDEIRQIEVVRGPESALYGFNAGEGVINIITFDPAQSDLNEVMGRTGNAARREGAIMATLPLASGIGLRLTAAGNHAQDVGDVRLATPQVANQNLERQSLAANFSAHLPNGDHATAEVSHTDLSVRAMVPQVTEFLDIRVQTDTVKADYSADTVIGLTGALLAFSSLTVPQASTAVNGFFGLHEHTIDAKLNDLVKIGPDDLLRFETEIRNEDVHTSNSAAPITSLLLGGSGMWEHQLLPELSIVDVVRYVSATTSQGDSGNPGTYVTFGDHGVSDNSALIYKAGENDTLRAAFSRGISLPSQLTFEQLGLAAPSSKKSTLANNPNIAITSVTESRLTWDHQLDDLAALARLSLYHKQSDNVIGLLPLQLEAVLLPGCVKPTIKTALGCKILARENSLQGLIQGAQLQLDHKSQNGWAWGFNYSFEQAHPHATANSGTLVPELLGTQRFHKVNANLGYGWRQWSADLRLSYSSPERALVLSTTPAPNVGLYDDKDVVTLSPHLAWSPREDISVDLAADNLWGYKADLVQRVPTSYFLTLKWLY